MDGIYSYRNVLKKYVTENTLKSGSNIREDTLLFQEGYFDSMGFALLIEFIENEFNITTSDEDLVEENFESIKAISKFIEHKKKEI